MTAGADFGARLASPGPQANLGLPYHCGGVRKPGTALVPRRDAAPGFGDLLFVEVCFDGRMIPQ